MGSGSKGNNLTLPTLLGCVDVRAPLDEATGELLEYNENGEHPAQLQLHSWLCNTARRTHTSPYTVPATRGQIFKDFRNWNRFHGVDFNCGIKSKLASIPKVGAGLDKGIPCSTLALGWT